MKSPADQQVQPPPNYRLQYSADQIRRVVGTMGGEIAAYAAEVRRRDGEDLLVMPILGGAIYFFADLTREITCSVEVVPGRARAYDPATNAEQVGEVDVSTEGADVSDRSVLLVDDICDSGKTLKAISDLLLRQGARDVRSAVLIHRRVERPLFTPTWSGFEYGGGDWFVGYGMDDRGRWRNLAGIYIIERGGESA